MSEAAKPLFAPLLALIGPTAVGKTSLALELAANFDLEIISADSRLFYCGLDIGTAKPSKAERERVPHHLIDVTTLDHPWSLADFHREATLAIEGIHERGNIPILVGGSGQYIVAILEGWRPPPRAHSDAYRKELEQYAAREGSGALHARLVNVDPVSAERIDHRNVRRVIRALEILMLTGKPASEQRIKESPPYDILRIGLTLSRPSLYGRIDDRINAMIEAGWESEVRQLIEQGHDFKSSPLSAIGYREIAQAVQGEISLEQAVRKIQRLSRKFVRRQANWFKADDERIHWFENHEGVLEEIITLIEPWIQAHPPGVVRS